MKNHFSKLKYLFKNKGIDEFIFRGVFDFVPLLEEIEKICCIRNKRFLANIGRNHQAHIQIIHPRNLYDSEIFPKEKKKREWIKFGYGLYVADFPSHESFQAFTKLDCFNDFFPVKEYEDMPTYFMYCGSDKKRVSQVVRLILQQVFKYQKNDLVHVNFFYWSDKRETFINNL